MNLPKDFIYKMRDLLKDEYEEFLKSYDEQKTQGLRINTLKISRDEFLKLNKFTLKDIPWEQNGFYYKEEERPGKHPYHEAGLYYIQEPSAMAVVNVLEPKEDEYILDLCAAPGGKSTHIASRMKNKGLLVSNEIHPKRAKILSENIERIGIKNTLVTNESPHSLSQRFTDFFDRILVDAPCSGEGMFRKDKDAAFHWNIDNIRMCAMRQSEILDEAKKMLKAGGILVYSTCTFSPEENEMVIERFLMENNDFVLLDSNYHPSFSKGRYEWTVSKNKEYEKTTRIWPHKLNGEGHFIAKLKKAGNQLDYDNLIYKKNRKNNKKIRNNIPSREQRKLFQKFTESTLNINPDGNFILFGDNLYLMPGDLNLKDLRVLRAGLHLGTFKKNRFEPSHALALYLKKEEVKNSINLSSEDDLIYSFLMGESFKFDCRDGYNLILVDGYSIGWGKSTGGIVKNHYPKGLRWTNK